MRNKRKVKDTENRKGIFLKAALYESEAFKKLTRAEIDILLVFYSKRNLAGNRAEKLGVAYDCVLNNGEIIFTYAEAVKRLDINKSTFTRGLDKLVEVGFEDIAVPSPGYKIPTKFAISERWREYGKPNSPKVKRPKADNGVGKIHWYKAKLKAPGLDNIPGTVAVEFPIERERGEE